jgi:HK97 family phage portal protein
MSKKRKTAKKTEKRNNQQKVGFFISGDDAICIPGYTSLDQNPEIMTACRTIAELIGSLTIHLMANTERGDIRVVNELSRAIDINPMYNMTRSTWMENIVMNLLLYGEGNSIVWPHTWDGIIRSLEPIAASRVSLQNVGFRDYQILIDGKAHDPENMLHFVYNPDKYYPWKGQGLKTTLKDVAANLKQAAATEKGFMESKWKPSLIVKVDAMVEEFSGPEGRKKLREDYLETGEAGAPWIIPAEQFEVQEVRPLSLSDLAISDMVQIDKRTVASIVGVPPFIVGVGEYSKDAWNSFVLNKVRPICIGIQQELTKKLILSPKMYLRFNYRSLLDWDIKTIYDVFGGLSDKGIVTGNEVRDILGMAPMDGLDELSVLENYIPRDKIGDQSKLTGGE